MIDKKWEHLMIDYLDGTLAIEQIESLEQALSESAELRLHLNQLRKIYMEIDNAPIHQPSKNLSSDFYAFLQKEQSKENDKQNNIIAPTAKSIYTKLARVAAVISILAIGYFVGNKTNNNTATQEEIEALKEEVKSTKNLMMLAMLKEKSASERIKAVEISYGIPETDKEIISALIETMNQDNNINVRSHAARALARFGEEEYVRKALIKSLKHQEEPEIQILLIDILTSFKEQGAIEEIISILKKEDLLDIVKFKAESSLEVLL